MADPKGTVVTTTTTNTPELVIIEATADTMTMVTLEEATEIMTMYIHAAAMEVMMTMGTLETDTINTILIQDRTIIPEVNLT